MKMRLLVVPFILFAGQLCGFGSHTFFGVRSQAANTARDLVGTQGLLPRLQPLACGVRKVDVVSDEHSVQRWGKDAVSKKRNYVPAPLCDKSYVVLSSAVEYSRSFHSDRMREFLFGCNKCLVFSGSRSEDRAGTDILADYFGLPADFKSTVKLPYVPTTLDNSILLTLRLTTSRFLRQSYERQWTSIARSRVQHSTL